jgi:hypothetical protein
MNIKKLLPIIGILLLIYILTTIDTEEILIIFTSINPIYSLISFLAIIPIVLLTSIQWQFVLKKHKIHISRIYSIKNILIGYFYGFITPGGLGAYTRALYLSEKSGASLPKCISNILVFNSIDFITLLLLGAIGGLLFSSRYPYLFLVILVVLILVILLFVFFLKKETSKVFFKRLLESQIFSSVKNKLDAPIDAFYEDLPSFRDLVIPFFISVFGWIIRFSEFYIIAHLFKVDVPYLYFILIIAMANVVATLPVTIYGLGTRDATLIALFFSMFAVAPSRILSLSLFWFVLVWLFPSIIGAFVTLLETKDKPKRASVN